MTIKFQPRALSVPYTSRTKLPLILEAFEGNILVPYDDLAAGHNATIGIGLNIRGNKDALRLVLDYLGVFQANATQDNLRAQQNLPPRTDAEILARHNEIIQDFVDVLKSHPLNGTVGHPGQSASEVSLKSALEGNLRGQTHYKFHGVLLSPGTRVCAERVS